MVCKIEQAIVQKLTKENVVNRNRHREKSVSRKYEKQVEQIRKGDPKGLVVMSLEKTLASAALKGSLKKL